MVLNEYVARFFMFLHAANKIDAMERLKMINVISIPHIKKAEANKIIRDLRKVFEDRGGIATPEEIKRDRERLMRKLRGKLL